MTPLRGRVQVTPSGSQDSIVTLSRAMSVHAAAAKISLIAALAAARQSRSDLYGLRQHQPIYFRGLRPSLVSVRSHTLVRPRGTHCLATSATFILTVECHRNSHTNGVIYNHLE